MQRCFATGGFRSGSAVARTARLLALGACAAVAGCAPHGPTGAHGADGVAGRLIVTFEDGLSGSFLLVEAELALDDRPLWTCNDPGRSLDAREPMLVHDGPVAGGPHRLTVSLAYRGQGHGVFSYLEGYTFRVDSAHEVALPASGTLAVRVVAYERGDVTTPIEERPQVRFEEQPFLLWAVQSRVGCPWAEPEAAPAR
jgi:hypothetical protein